MVPNSLRRLLRGIVNVLRVNFPVIIDIVRGGIGDGGGLQESRGVRTESAPRFRGAVRSCYRSVVPYN